jgi:replicative DNA helicase
VSDRVVELPSQGRQVSTEFERTPPQDVAAEQSVLGGMLLSKDAIADVVEVVRANDFYKPAHQTIFDVIVDLYGKGEPADPITVSAELTRLGEIGRVGGAPYLHTLLSSVPTAANAGFYARIVQEQAVLRRLVEAGTRIVQLGYGASGSDVDDIVDRAQQSVYDVTERRSSEDYTLLEELMQPTMDELEAIGSRGGGMSGVPTGFVDLDALTNGLHPGQLIVIAGRPGLGKALALDTPLPTPTGWTTMGTVAVGDQLLGADGRATTVVAATDVMVGRPCFEVVFSDGTTVVADAEHQWLTETRASRRSAGSTGAAIRTTAEIAGSVRCATADGRANHSVAVAAPLELPPAALPLPPYVLGVWLGDGHSAGARFTTADPDVAMYVEAHGIDVVPRSGQLPGDGEHIPAAYLRASERQRRDLLAGLLDTDGTVSPDGSVQFCVTSRRLAEETRELIVSLGYRCSMTTRRVRGRSEQSSTAYTLNFATSDEVFQLPRKALLHKERCKGGRLARTRFITDVRPVASVPVRCVEVDNADQLYLATRSMVPTHNSTLGLDIARSASVKSGQASCIFSLEMSKTEITMRLLSAEARVPLHHMRAGTMTDDDWARLARRMGEVAEAPLFIDDSPNLTMMEIRAKARRLRQRHDLKLVVIDYLQLMSGNKKAESRQQEVSELSRNLKLLAKELEVPVIAMSQLNRGAEQRTDKKPQLADLRESGSIEQDADMVILLHRDDAYEKESPRAGEADFIVAKHRNGPTSTITVAFQGHYSRFVDMNPG